MTRRAAILALIALAFLIAPETRADTREGYASAYAEGVMDDVIRTRFANDWWPSSPPRNWYESHGAIAVVDCRRVGEMATLIDADGKEYRVLIADCGERNKPGEGGH